MFPSHKYMGNQTLFSGMHTMNVYIEIVLLN